MAKTAPIRNYEALDTRLAKEYAAKHGFKGEVGGWIHSESTGRPIAQGWSSFYRMQQELILDEITQSFSTFKTFSELLKAPGGYRPTMDLGHDWRLIHLALRYNQMQAFWSDPRRAYVKNMPANLPLWMQKELQESPC